MNPTTSAPGPAAKPHRFKIIGKVSDILAARKAKKAAASVAAIAALADAGPKPPAPRLDNRPAPVRPSTTPFSPAPTLGTAMVDVLTMAYGQETDSEKKADIFTLIKAARGQEEESTETLAAAYAQERDPAKKSKIFLRLQAARVAEATCTNADSYSRVSARIAATKRR